MNIVFRADASSIIGIGHIMRCLTLAHQLQKNGATVSFICRAHQGHRIEFIKQSGFKVFSLPKPSLTIYQNDSFTWLGISQQQDAKESLEALSSTKPIDWIITDHYAIDYQWHKLMRPYCSRVMVIDDLANRVHDCDILLDQTINRQAADYQSYVPNHCRLLLGQHYILFRNEFATLRQQAEQRRILSKQFRSSKVLIAMGGGDPDNITLQAISALSQLKQQYKELEAQVVLSSSAPHLKTIQQQCDDQQWLELIVDTNEMAQLMLNADFAIGACGTTSWERCYLGLPTVTIITAENQQLIAQQLEQQQTILNIGKHDDVSANDIAIVLKQLLDDADKYQHISQQCFKVCSGLGTQQVSEEILHYV